MQFIAYAMRPTSQGGVRIVSADPKIPPRISAEYLREEYDRRVTIGVFRYIRRYAQQPALDGYLVDETYPGTAVQTDDEIVDFAQRAGLCGLHAIGTCKMGTDALSVVDPMLRVKGVSGLRVVDCSVMPSMISGHTNGPVMALAWRAAELIRDSHK